MAGTASNSWLDILSGTKNPTVDANISFDKDSTRMLVTDLGIMIAILIILGIALGGAKKYFIG